MIGEVPESFYRKDEFEVMDLYNTNITKK